MTSKACCMPALRSRSKAELISILVILFAALASILADLAGACNCGSLSSALLQQACKNQASCFCT